MRYDTFDSNDTLETKLLTGKSGYDVVVPTAYFLERQIKAGVFQKLDKSKLSNIGNVWPEIAARLATYDPGNLYAVNYMWGTTGIGFNVKKLREILGPDAKIESWDVVFKPENLAKFKECGVMMLDSSDDILPAALRYLGLDPNTKDAADLEKAAELVAKVRPSVRKFHSSEYHQRARRAAKSVSWSAGRATSSRRRSAASRPRAASISAMRSRRKARKCGSTISRSRRMRRMSRRRTNSSITCCGRKWPRAIPISSSYANGNLASQKLIDKAILNDPTVYPDEATMKTLYTIVAHDQKTQRAMNRLWTKIKTGR